MKKTAVFLADGFEEVEAFTQVDLLKRAGIEVKTVSITENKEVMGTHGIKTETDMVFDKAVLENFDGIVLPGGMPGADNLMKYKPLTDLIIKFNGKGKMLGAICAAPMIFGQLGILNGKKACSYPGFEKYLTGAEVEFNAVSHDGNIITSRGVGTAIEFAAEMTEFLLNKETAEEVLESIVYKKK